MSADVDNARYGREKLREEFGEKLITITSTRRYTNKQEIEVDKMRQNVGGRWSDTEVREPKEKKVQM